MCKEVSYLTEDASTLVNRVLRMKAEKTSATQEFLDNESFENNTSNKAPKLKTKLAYIENANMIMLELLSLTEVSKLSNSNILSYDFNIRYQENL